MSQKATGLGRGVGNRLSHSGAPLLPTVPGNAQVSLVMDYGIKGFR